MASQITNLTNFPDQQLTLQLPDGSSLTFEIIYHGATSRWIANFSYGTVSVSGIGLCCSPNMLRQWAKNVPFGMACVTADQTDPFDINDFVTGRVSLYLLTQSDVTAVETSLYGAQI